MSEAAIVRRLKTVDQLRTLCLSLMKAKRDSDAKAGKVKLSKEKAETGEVEASEK